jgi:hypothetical protein
LITYDIDSKKENVDFNDMEGLSRWLKTNYESNDNVTKKKSVFMEALMKTPVYNSEHLKVNWSFPIKNDDNNDLPSDTE